MNKTAFQDRLQESLRIFNHHMAVRFGSETMTYEDLDRKSNGIANWLLDKKVMRETLIGILMTDRIRFIYTMIGILKAGCVFVSLDPAYPDSKLNSMIKFTGTSLVLADKLNHKRGGQSKFICIDNMFSEEDCERYNRPVELAFSTEDPIYIYFTSGSSGFPKAILGKNKSLLHFIDWEIKTFSLDESAKVSQFTTTGFDAFLRDIFVPLFSGGCINIPEDPDILTNSERLIRWIDTSGLNLIHCVPSLFKMINNKDATLLPTYFQELKYVLLSGERIPPRDLVRWYEIFSERIQLVNFWGPTETTMIKTFYFICKTDVEKENIPIGKPIGGTRVIIMDETMKVCKERIPGKLYIRTPYRSFGYCNDPVLTHAKFIRNPFNNDPADLLYDTGDQGLLLANGNIEFLGRQDRQVKIMGIRIELDGIENILLKHPAIDEAAAIKQIVASKTSKPDEELLCVYFSRKKNDTSQEMTAADIRSYLLNELPGYMVPPMVLEIEKIPRKSNGKIDYDSLPDPFKEKEKEYVPPITELQMKLAGLWSEILKINKISIKSHFFELGGNSLNLMALVSKIHREFDVRISLEKMFNNPTVEMQATVINELEREQYFSIELVEKKEYYLLSPAQERLYFLHQLEKNSTAYNMPQLVSLHGKHDKKKLAETFRELIKRHESFRTSFEMINGKSVQRVHEDEKLEFEIFSFECSEREAENIVKEFFRPFDLGRAPLLRVGFIQTGDSQGILIVDMHHIITDGTSLTLLINEFMQIYAGEKLPGLNVQYKDFAEWWHKENKWLKKQEEYWLQEFAEGIPVLDLPTDFTRPPVQNFEGNALNFRIAKEQTKQLKNLSASHGITLFMTLMAVFNVFLSKISGQEDIVVGTGVEGRNHDDIRRIIGMFVNTLALKNHVEYECSFFEFLEEVKYRVLRGLENQDYPFERLVEKLKVSRDTSRNPLFDVVFMLQNMAQPGGQVPHLELNSYSGKIERTAKFDLTFQVMEVGETLMCEFEYSTRLFRRETMERFVRYLKKILAEILRSPWKKLAEIEIISGEDKRQILYDFNDTATAYPSHKTVHQLFEEQVQRVPDGIAIIGESVQPVQPVLPVTLTYSRLNEQATRLAELLISKGVMSDSIVAIMMERSLEMIVGILGILKAGGAYLPIDQEYPEERIDYMLKDSKARLLVTTNDLESEKVRSWEGEKVLLEFILHHSNSFSYQHSALVNQVIQHTNHLAYIIYTSGTTGKPKGVMIDHRSAVNLIFNQGNYFNINESDRILQFSSICFDASVEQIFIAFSMGAVLVLIDKITLLDISKFDKYVSRQQVTHIHAVPSFLNNIQLSNTSQLKRMVAGGDVCPVSLAKKWNNICDFYNECGPTETTVTSIELWIKDSDASLSRLPIGKPINNTFIYILDRWLKPVPLGVIGEMYIGGEGVARGYLNRPELTAEKFINFHHSSFITHRSKLYCTGDLVRWLDDGNIEFLGRIDHQVKIRGFRIELGEIECKLQKHGQINESVVLSSKNEHGDNFLIAYISPTAELSATELREYLSKELPAYMLPSHFVQVEKIPLTPNGKIDHKALNLIGKHLEIGTVYVAPQNEMERKIADIWKEVLHKDNVGINDNYFELGGTSFDILRIYAQLKESFQIDMAVVDMFTYPTVHLFAEYIINSKREKLEKIRDRKVVFERSKIDRREQLQRRKGIRNIEIK